MNLNFDAVALFSNMKSAIQSIAFVLFAGLALAGCNKHDDITPDRWNGEIRLSSEIASQVKTRATDVPDKQIASGKNVSFFVDDAVTKAMLYQDCVLTANGNGGFTKFNSSAADMFFPETGNGVDIYAFLTDGFVSNSPFPSTAITHTVSSDQSEQHGANYLSSDLLYAAHKAVTRSNQPVPMSFYHLLSKVEVALKAGAGAPDLTDAVVTIENTRLKADFLPNKTVDINHATTGQATRAAMITPTATNNPTAPIIIGTAVSADFSAYASAVVVPQTVAQNSRFIKVTLASGGKLYYTIPDADGLELKSGHKYRFQITVNLTGLTVQSTISDWATGAPIGGTAEMPPTVGSKEPATATIGDFYFSDGTLEDKDATLTPDQQAACIGIVFWLRNITNDDPLLRKNHPDCTHGLVVALHDAGGNSLWSSNYEEITGNWLKNQGSTYGITTLKESNKMQGYANTQALIGYNASDRVSGNSGLKVLPIEAIATTYAAAHSAPVNSSGWYFPSVMELKYMCWGQGNGGGTAGRVFLNTQFGKVSGASPLQSSTEYGYGWAWNVYFDVGDVDNLGYKDLYSFGVRAVAAF